MNSIIFLIMLILAGGLGFFIAKVILKITNTKDDTFFNAIENLDAAERERVRYEIEVIEWVKSFMNRLDESLLFAKIEKAGVDEIYVRNDLFQVVDKYAHKLNNRDIVEATEVERELGVMFYYKGYPVKVTETLEGFEGYSISPGDGVGKIFGVITKEEVEDFKNVKEMILNSIKTPPQS